MNQTKSRYSLILSKEDMNRICSIKETKDGGVEVISNVHGLKVWQAKVFINNLINLASGSIKLDVIHGYHNGNAIKNMIQNDLSNRKIINKIADKDNAGLTHIIAA